MFEFLKYVSFVDIFNMSILIVFTICYIYQYFYIIVGLVRDIKFPEAKKNHTFASIICARNEEQTIGNLIDSIKAQSYPKDKLDIFVIADNCTDNTSQIALSKGAYVIPRKNDKLVGKGYAMDYGLNVIMRQMMGVPAAVMGTSVCKKAQSATILAPKGKKVLFPNNKLTDDFFENRSCSSDYKMHKENEAFDISNYDTPGDGRGYEAFFIFDADNVLDKNYFAAMNKAYDVGFSVCTSYRNAKNWDHNWISSGYATWFMREARFLNQPRCALHTSCSVSGTGFYVDSRIILKNKGWKWFLLTEDIQFASQNIISANRIGYVPDAILYDEQPVKLIDSWNQRFRWTRGFYQVFAYYGGKLFKHIFTNPRGHKFACYDMLMTIAPGMLLTIISLIFNAVVIFLGIIGVLSIGMCISSSLTSILFCIVNFILLMFIFGLITIFVEWNNIRATSFKKVKSIFTFPFFMLTYIPLAVVALFKKVEWKPIKHTFTVNIEDFKDHKSKK